jgi:hypothetical protein
MLASDGLKVGCIGGNWARVAMATYQLISIGFHEILDMASGKGRKY